MSEFDWATFLRRCGEDVLASPAGQNLPSEVRESGWLGFAPATERGIAAAEQRLCIPLPPSYKAFLKVSNGWRKTSHAIERVWGTDQIDWFRKRSRDWIKAYSVPLMYGPREEVADEEYFAYEQWAEDFRRPHLKETLQISEIGDAAVYLLNPQVITKDGEWEAWFFANWIPGAHRYRSFLEMMQAEYHQFAGIDWKQPAGVLGELPDEYVGSPGSPKRRLKKRRRPRPFKVLGRRLDQWTVEELVSFLENPEFWQIHGDAADALGRMGDDRAVEPLLKLLHDDSGASGGALYALKRLAPERLPELLLNLLKQRHVSAFDTAAVLLAELGEERAIPLLIDILRDERREAQYFCAARLISMFGQSGFEALKTLVENEPQHVRRQAAAGLLDTNRPEARDIFERLLDDLDPEIRDLAKVALDILPPRRRKK